MPTKPTKAKKPKAKKPLPRPQKKEKKTPSWFNVEEIRKKGVEAVAREHNIKVETVYRTLNKAGISAKELAPKEEKPSDDLPSERVLHTIGLEDETYKEFQVAKQSFEGRAARSLDDSSFTRVLLALYRLVGQE